MQTPRIIALAVRLKLPTVSSVEGFAAAGGLMNYGTSIVDANRQLGVYTGKVLKGTKPADLPVMQPTKFKLVINLKTASALGTLAQVAPKSPAIVKRDPARKVARPCLCFCSTIIALKSPVPGAV